MPSCILAERGPSADGYYISYIQLYLSLFISLFFIPQIVKNINPSRWNDPFLYVMFFLSVVPVLTAQILEFIVATNLLFSRNEHNVKLLRKTLIILIATGACGLAIDVTYFEKSSELIFDIVTIAFAIIWYLYFLKAQRVKLVFIDLNWIYTSYQERSALSPKDKKKLRNRSLISALIVFVLFLLWTGSTLKNLGKQPSMGIFAMPLFYAVVAAVIAWYLPIRKKQKETDNVEDVSLNAVTEKHDI